MEIGSLAELKPEHWWKDSSRLPGFYPLGSRLSWVSVAMVTYPHSTLPAIKFISISFVLVINFIYF